MRKALLTIGRLVALALIADALPCSLRAQVPKVYLGDIAAGGDGTDTAAPEILGINPDTGVFEEFFIDGPIGIGDGASLQPVEDAVSELIDAVFIIDMEEMPINSAGVTFTFPPEDLLAPPQTWGQILKDRVGGELTPLAMGGVAFERGVGIHATAGITYDLDALRSIHGPEKIGQITALAGMGDSAFGGCAGAGSVTAYIILSDDGGILDSASHRASVGGERLRLTIPPEARFLTLACGAGNGQFYCNSGSFGDAFITPAGVCLVPPATATRELEAPRTPEEANGDFKAGDIVEAAIVLSDVRQADANCGAPAGVVLRETLPAGWTPSAISDGGTYDPASSAISWRLSGAALAEGKKVSYKVTAQATTEPEVTFRGTIAEDAPFAEASPVQGDSVLQSDVPFDACGGIRAWNILGAFLQPYGDNPGDENLRLDYLTDGETAETDFVFFPGAQVGTAFGGDGVSGAASTGITGGAQGRNAEGIPTVFAWNDRDGRIDLNGEAFGGDPDGVMAYAQAYVDNTTGADIEVTIGVSSDDSVQVLLNGAEVWIHSPRTPAVGLRAGPAGGGSLGCAQYERC
ncbi:MAG: NPCBM/NEW2 domain-containing protein [Planctomycetes bacterium]|nr:NPCBM/NEW2 domain-containing protein [Planctomycetota bacterium]